VQHRAIATEALPKLRVNNLNFYYGARQVLQAISLDILAKKVTALIGPSGCGKSTFLRTLNRMYETIRHARAEGEVLLDGENIIAKDVRIEAASGNGLSKVEPISQIHL
jgi:phosphate transport system ATP-binding protein